MLDQSDMEIEFTRHALDVMDERRIERAWVEWTVERPVRRLADPHDEEVERFYRNIPERGDHVLRVAVNTTATPWRVVSVFFDRRMRGRL